MPEIITKLAQFKKGWTGGLPETPCGYGSTLAATKLQRKWISGLIKKYEIRSIADIGAGDLNWIKEMRFPDDVKYKAYDLVPRLPEIRKFNIIKSVPVKADMLMCLWVLNHLPYNDVKKALANLKESGSKYLLMTDRQRCHKNQPPEIHMEHIEIITVSNLGDTIKLIKL